jgi:hypothetical protein
VAIGSSLTPVAAVSVADGDGGAIVCIRSVMGAEALLLALPAATTII